MRKSWLAVSLLMVAAIPSTWASECPPMALEAKKVMSTRQQLLSVHADDSDTAVPDAAQSLIPALKTSLAQMSTAAMSCAAPSVEPVALQTQLAAAVSANAAPAQGAPDGYGSGLSVKVSRPANRPELMAIEWHFGIECGFDSLLMIYEPVGAAWHESLRWQSLPYKEISGAFGDLFLWTVLPQSGRGWELAVAHGTPWCTSRFSRFAVDLLDPQESAPAVRMHMADSYSRGDLEPRLRALRDGFELRIERSSLDLDGVFTRYGIFRYRVAPEGVARVQPIALNGRDFLDEWLMTDWRDAVRWTAPGKAQELHSAHSDLHASSEVHYGPVRGCGDDPRHYQVMLTAGEATTYFQLLMGENSFLILSASEQADALCAGKDIMPKGRN